MYINIGGCKKRFHLKSGLNIFSVKEKFRRKNMQEMCSIIENSLLMLYTAASIVHIL